MPLLKKILEKLARLHYQQEYLCFARESFEHPLHSYLLNNGRIIKDVSSLHSFVGYSPLIFVFPFFPEVPNEERVEVLLTNKVFSVGEKYHRRDVVAFLLMKKIKAQSTKAGEFFYYEGLHGTHDFTSVFHQYIAQLHNRLYNRNPGNVFLEGNLFKQVQIAYAVPRKICLVTVEINGLYNLFPTDLHGQVGDRYYVVSLRHQGKACEQVITSGKILLADMEATAYKKVYGLGKNHMQPLKEAELFDFSATVSDVLKLPLPNGLVAYKELQLQDSFIHGIHRLLLFKILNSKSVVNSRATLAHVHNSYATWRHKKGLKSNYLLR